jgi:hypothetical protein
MRRHSNISLGIQVQIGTVYAECTGLTGRGGSVGGAGIADAKTNDAKADDGQEKSQMASRRVDTASSSHSLNDLMLTHAIMRPNCAQPSAELADAAYCEGHCRPSHLQHP